MLNSREIDRLRPDVAANCRLFLGRCREAGLNVLVTGTVRDEAYQRYCYEQGRASTPYPSFHGVKAGLAFDVCKNVKGHEYDDGDFFRRAGEIGEAMGFEWGGRWTRFPDKPHFQWSQGGKYTSAMVRSGKLPPDMPICEEENEMTREEVQAMIDEGVKRGIAEYEDAVASANSRPVSPWAAESWEKATKAGVFDGSRPGAALRREEAAVVLDRLGLLERKV